MLVVTVVVAESRMIEKPRSRVIRIHKDHMHTLKILYFMSDLG